MKNLRPHNTYRPHYPIIAALAIDPVWERIIKPLANIKSPLDEIVASQRVEKQYTKLNKKNNI